MGQLLQEIRAKKLDRIAAAYAVVAWIVVQGAAIALPSFNAAPWLLRALIILAVVGFFVTLAGAWLWMPAHPDTSARTKRLFGAAVIGGVVVAVVLGVIAYSNSGEDVAAVPVAPPPL